MSFQPLRHCVPPPPIFCVTKHPVMLRGTAEEEFCDTLFYEVLQVGTESILHVHFVLYLPYAIFGENNLDNTV